MNPFHKIALESLKKNRTRTAVIITGVILSAAMISGVIVFAGSLQNFLVEGSIATKGDWYGMAEPVDKSRKENLEKISKVSATSSYQIKGYSKLDKHGNKYKPYIFVAAFDDDMYDTGMIKMIHGRKPKNPEEIVIPEHLITDGEQDIGIGQKISLDLGEREYINGRKKKQVYQNVEYIPGKENFSFEERRTFKIVGICERPATEPYQAAGYTAITAPEKTGEKYGVYIKTKDPGDIYKVIKNIKGEKTEISYNEDLLTYLGAGKNETINEMLFGLAAFLIVLIMLGSIFLIYNTFSISLSERERETALLMAIGATRKQVRRSVFYEALLIGGIGIPIGIIAGIAIVGGFLFAAKNLFSGVGNLELSGVSMTLFVTYKTIILAFLVSLATILISAMIPAFRASRASIINTVRQVYDFRISRKKTKGYSIVSDIFGVYGTLAIKNYSRNTRQYRVTVFSLLISIILFISVSSYTHYLTSSVDALFGESEEYQITYNYSGTSPQKGKDNYNILSNAEGVTKKSFAQVIYMETEITADKIDKKTLNLLRGSGYLKKDKAQLPVRIFVMDERSYKEYLKNQGLDPKLFTDPENPKAVALREGGFYDITGQKYRKMNIYGSEKAKNLLVRTGEISGLEEFYSVAIGAFTDEVPAGAGEFTAGFLMVTTPKTADIIFRGYEKSIETSTGFFKSDDTKTTYESMTEIAATSNIPKSSIINEEEEEEISRSLMTAVNIFSYGFIVLISLIAVANVFNTISTNILLRRREFAILKAVGLSESGFMKMMNLECLFYGLKSLLYGLPVAIIIAYIIYRNVNTGTEIAFSVPVHSVVISIISIFIIVFATMIYATHKIAKEDSIEVIKNEPL